MALRVQRVEVGSKNRSKNEVNMGRHLGIDFYWILVDFWVQVGGTTEQQSIQKTIEKTMRKQKSSKTRFLIDLGAILALQNGAKTLKNRC